MSYGLKHWRETAASHFFFSQSKNFVNYVVCIKFGHTVILTISICSCGLTVVKMYVVLNTLTAIHIGIIFKRFSKCSNMHPYWRHDWTSGSCTSFLDVECSFKVWLIEWRMKIGERKWGRKTRHSLLPSSFSCCCSVMEALYVLKTFAVNPGMRELRCLFSSRVCKGKNKTLKIAFKHKHWEIIILLSSFTVNHKMALLPLLSANTYAQKRCLKEQISIGQSIFYF